MKTFVTRTLCLLLAAALPLLLHATHYAPIEDVDVDAYLGVWFQTYASASVKYTFELGGNCVTARYRKTSRNRTIEVQNVVRPCTSFNDGSIPFGDLIFNIVINGYAVQSNTTDGQLQVTLPRIPGLPFGLGTPDINDVTYTDPGNYWIIELGPINDDGKYDYSIVTNNEEGDQLYVLVRNVTVFEQLYEKDVLKNLEEYGFTKPFNKPRKTNQKNCNYEYYKFEDDFDT